MTQENQDRTFQLPLFPGGERQYPHFRESPGTALSEPPASRRAPRPSQATRSARGSDAPRAPLPPPIRPRVCACRRARLRARKPATRLASAALGLPPPGPDSVTRSEAAAPPPAAGSAACPGGARCSRPAAPLRTPPPTHGRRAPRPLPFSLIMTDCEALAEQLRWRRRERREEC